MKMYNKYLLGFPGISITVLKGYYFVDAFTKTCIA